MPSRDEELALLFRGIFLPEEGEVWAKPDASQQEFRFVVHYANQHKLRNAAEAVARYREDPDADFHAFAATITGLDRSAAKAVNFAKMYGAGVTKFAQMIARPLAEAQQLYARYDRDLPFLHLLSKIYTRRANAQGYIVLYDGVAGTSTNLHPAVAVNGRRAPARAHTKKRLSELRTQNTHGIDAARFTAPTPRMR